MFNIEVTYVHIHLIITAYNDKYKEQIKKRFFTVAMGNFKQKMLL